MRRALLSALLILATLTIGCKKNEPSKEEMEALKAGIHKVEALEVIQVTSYTYMRVDENGKEYWLAGPKMEAAKGNFYYYDSGMEMKGFKSTELNRTFESRSRLYSDLPPRQAARVSP